MSKRDLEDGVFLDSNAIEGAPYHPNEGVFLAGLLGKARGDGFGFYRGTMRPGCEIATERHSQTSETVYILAGRARGFIGSESVELQAGQVLHVHPNVPHGLRNIGDSDLDFLVIGHPDF